MLLFQKRFHAGLVDGSITLTFRQWPTARVKPGGRYRVHPIGVVVVRSVEQVRVADITERDARRAGFESRAELIEYLKPAARGRFSAATKLWRIELEHGGDADFVEIASAARLSGADVKAIAERLARWDAKRAWTAETLAIIQRQPRVAASQLAAELGRETQAFKTDVRKLKHLGLTQSHEVGYSLSPRGKAYLRRVKSHDSP